MATFPSDSAEKFVVRFPDGMRDRISEAAKSNGRTMNSEIVARLEESFQAVRQDFRREVESQVAAIQNRIALLGMRFDLSRSRSENLEIRTHLISADSVRLAKEAKTDEEFAAVQKSIDLLHKAEAEVEVLRKEMHMLIVERESALQDLHRLESLMGEAAQEIEDRIRKGLAARAAKDAASKP